MQMIANNPYRILGLSVTATDREITKRISELTIYTEMGKAKNYDSDLINFAPLERTTENIEDAARQLEQPKDKLLHSIFWLSYNNNENFLDKLDNDNLSEVIENIPNDTVHNFHNKAILTLLSVSDFNKLRKGIRYFEDFLTHKDIEKFITKIVGERLTRNFDIDKLFIEYYLQDVMNKYSIKEILDLFNNTSNEEFVRARLVKPYIHKIEAAADTAKNKTNNKPENAYSFGKELIDNISDNLSSLEEILDESDLMFTSISNKLAEQMLDCSIAYFNKNFESSDEDIDEDIFENAYELAKTAQLTAKSRMMINRINEAIKALENTKFHDCFNAVNFLKAIIEAYEKLEKENMLLISFKRKCINEILMIRELRKVVTSKIIMKIAKSTNEKLISDFSYYINSVINKMKLTKDVAKLKSKFIENLPDTNEIKREYNLNLFKELIKQKEFELEQVRERTFFSTELFKLKCEMKELNKWTLFRTKKTKELQINKKTLEIEELKTKGEKWKKEEIARLDKEIIQKKHELQKL